eukprot:CAMPEP_0197433978 /NCGR_PEP_ID=MMETSP1175-20131217/1773_1 /TAXON_ID=1003142 /ORGANISM="Triceratium dubium, Strain CCMP147" /LENGTH=630 /DNA_ID=CAMNT_0042962533 /DNA_START=175 /DNA_END=2067 /DNA_ORIENTATION=+
MKNAREAFHRQRRELFKQATQQQNTRKEKGNKYPHMMMECNRKKRRTPFPPRHENIPRKMKADVKASETKKAVGSDGQNTLSKGVRGGDRWQLATSAVASKTLARAGLNKKKNERRYNVTAPSRSSALGENDKHAKGRNLKLAHHNIKSTKQTIVGLDKEPKPLQANFGRKNKAHFKQTSTGKVGSFDPPQVAIQTCSGVASKKRDDVAASLTRKRPAPDGNERSAKSARMKKEHCDSSYVRYADKQPKSHSASGGLNCADKSPQCTAVGLKKEISSASCDDSSNEGNFATKMQSVDVPLDSKERNVPLKTETQGTNQIAPLKTKSEVQHQVNISAIKGQKWFLDTSAMAMRHIRDLCHHIRCGTFIVQIRVPIIRHLVLSEAARKAKNAEDRIYFSMAWDNDEQVIISPDENLPAFSPSLRVAFKSEPIAIRLNCHFPFTFEKKRIILNVFKGNRSGQHVKLFTCSLSGESIVKRATEQLNGKGSPSIIIPCALTEYIRDAQVEFELTTSPLDATDAEREKMNNSSELLALTLNDDISTVLGSLNLANEASERDTLASHMGSKSYGALLSELLDVAIFFKNYECISHLLGVGAVPSSEGVKLSETLEKKCYEVNQKHAMNAENNDSICK